MYLPIFILSQLFLSLDLSAPGPAVKPSKGKIWPKPFEQKETTYFSIVRPNLLGFEVENYGCDILDEAIKRHKNIIDQMLQRNLYQKDDHPKSEFQNNNNSSINVEKVPLINQISINLKNPCEQRPHSEMKEEYTLTVISTKVYIYSESIWGILRGLESFSQLLVFMPDYNAFRINEMYIYDKPKYSHRGLLVDTSRHFIDVLTLKKIIDGMAYNKLNVFHWHIVDDPSFPYESKTFPELSREGAFKSNMVYSQSQIQYIIEYARLRGIRTLAEFDTPGHTQSWGISHPEILTACEGPYDRVYGPIDPTKNETYTFMQKLLEEVVDVFPDEYIHLGGDEVKFWCWNTSRHIHDFMKAHNMTKFTELEEYYIQNVVDMVKNLSRKSIVWQEVFENGVKLAPGTTVQIWTGNRKELLNKVTKRGLPAIVSDCWYLDHLSDGGDWQKYYTCDPNDFPGDAKQKSLLIGGEACIWSEVVDNTNILQRIFPRLSAAAEVLWSQRLEVGEARNRIEEHACRMRDRDIPAQPPNGAGFC